MSPGVVAEGVSAQPTKSMFVYQALGNRARSVSTNRYANRLESSCPARRAGACERTALLRPARAKLPAPSAQIVRLLMLTGC
jgi:hypothetical protein